MISHKNAANILAGIHKTGNNDPALVIVFEIESEKAARRQEAFAAIEAAIAAESAASDAKRIPSGARLPSPYTDSSAMLARAAAAAKREKGKNPKARLRLEWTRDDNNQAEFLWGKCNSTDNICYCCICGFPIIPDNEEVFPGEPVGTVERKWGQGSAEHELYASKGYRYIGLYWRALDDIDKLRQAGLPRGYDEDVKNFYRKEMMWSHWYCNNIKGDVPVIQWTRDMTNLEPNLNNIRYIINSVWNGVPRVDNTTAAFYPRYVNNVPGVKVGGYSHLIEYFLNNTGPVVRTKEEGDRKVLAWKNNRLCAYITRLNDMIVNLRNCARDISPDAASLYEGLRPILDERTRNPYGRIAGMPPLTEWPPSGVAITPTLPPSAANFEPCDGAKESDFWAHVEAESDQEYEYETQEDSSEANWTAADQKELQRLIEAEAAEVAAAAADKPAGGAGGPPRLRKTYGGARRYKQRKTLKKRRKVKRHTRRRT